VPRFLKWPVPIRKWPNPTEAELTEARTALKLRARARACVCVLQFPPFLPVHCILYFIIVHAWPARRA
jgi:hypothetical protein